MPKVCHLDIETFSEAPLKKCGLYVYAEHPSTEIWCICYAFDDEPVQLWIPEDREFIPPKLIKLLYKRLYAKGFTDVVVHYSKHKCPVDLWVHAKKEKEFRAHNSSFERILLNGHAGKAIGFPETQISQWICTAAKAASHALPRALMYCAKACETHPKDADGGKDMMALCKPRAGKVKRYTHESAPEKYVRAFTYCIDDVYAEKGIDDYIPDLSKYEQRVFEMDQRINDRGIKADLKAVADVQVLIKEYKTFLENRCREWTGFNPTQTEKLANWVRANGYPDLENLQAPTIKVALEDPDCPKVCKRVLRLRAIHSMKAVAKYTAIENAICLDERLRGMFLYHAASTGRWSSLVVQLQNLFRPVIDDPETAIIAFSQRDLDFIRTLYDKDPMKVFASCVRGMLIPDYEMDIMAMDYASIEARVNAWLAGEEEVLEVFRGHGLMYEYVASQIYGTPNDEATLRRMEKEFPERRFIGKIAVLALGYQGGKKAFAKMAKNYGVTIAETLAEKIKEDWRDANQNIVNLWSELDAAAIAATLNKGVTYSVQKGKIMFRFVGDFLYMRLPSGRKIAYFKPKIDADGKFTYMGTDTYTRQWCRCSMYGGKWCENAVQGIARDLLVHGMFNLERADYPIIGTVHDECLMEILESFGSLEECEELLCELPPWAAGLPVKAKGFRAKRFKK